MSGILYCVDTRSSRILDNHAACNLLALNMHLLYLILVSVPHVSARAGVVPPDTFYVFPRYIFRRRSLVYGLNHASCSSSVTDHAIRHSVSHGPCRATGVPAAAFSPIPRPSRAVQPSCFPADYSCWSSRPSYLVGSKRALEHNIALPSASGSVAAAPPVIEIM